jgi:methylated-DNA-[protein]-cysteine S-methyltransferase
MKKIAYTSTVLSPIGNLGIITANDKLLKIDFLVANNLQIKPSTEIDREFAQQLQHYFKDPHFNFEIPYELNGTPYQIKVLHALKKIPVGKTKTYGEFAKNLNSGPRAIGGACRSNPIPLVIPCHRIVAKNNLGGFAGENGGKLLEIKKWLLDHEKHLRN